MSECVRILKPGGQFIQTMNLGQSLFKFYDQMEIVLKEMGMNDEIVKMHEHITHKRLPIEKMKSLL